jgi:transposase
MICSSAHQKDIHASNQSVDDVMSGNNTTPAPSTISPVFPTRNNCELQSQVNSLKREASYWKAMHQRAKQRESELVFQNKELKAEIKKLQQSLYGRKTEKGTTKSENADNPSPKPKPKRARGQQPGSKGHGRKDHSHLPIKDEFYDLPDGEKCCPNCHAPYTQFYNTEDSEQIEIEVKAHIRRIRRKKYKTTCTCDNLPVIVTAPGPDKLIPKGAYGDSVWVQVLLNKFYSYCPTYRYLDSLKLIDLDIPQGTVTDNLKRLTPLFEPVYAELIKKSQTETHWHADETRWAVFESVEGKIGYRWYLWVFKSESVSVFILDQTRSAQVPREHLANINELSFLSVDRYSAYKVIKKEKEGTLLLAYCWTHVRRDFLAVATGHPSLESWASDWVDDIGTLYHINNERIQADDPLNSPQQQKLETAINAMAEKADRQLADDTLHSKCEKVLISLHEHWDGLTIFVDHPEIPMDNNTAERELRGPAVGRKNFYGSGAVWSGQLAAMLFTILRSALLWNINPKYWVEVFFAACAANGGKPPDDITRFLPWNMNPDRKPMAYDTS